MARALTPILTQLLPTERLLFSSGITCAGTFACGTADPLFQGGQPSTSTCIVFSRTPVVIQHEGGVRYVADPTVVTFHNRGRSYRRWKVAETGDRCDWIAYGDNLLRDVVGRWDPRRFDRAAVVPFGFQFVGATAPLYLRQRRLFNGLRDGCVDRLQADEEAIGLLATVTAAAYGARRSGRRRAGGRDVDAVHHVRLIIARDPSSSHSLSALASGVGMSPCALCRAFSRVCGETMTAYRNRLRLLSSLEAVRAGEDLSSVALGFGYSSHSHFTAAFRELFGVVPSSLRRSKSL